MPPGDFGLLSEYIIECPTFVRSARMGDFYLHLLGVAPAAEDWHQPSQRGNVYVLRSHGTARTPMSVRFQSPSGGIGNPEDPNAPPPSGYAFYGEFLTPGHYNWTAPLRNPPTPGNPLGISYWAPDGTPEAVQLRVHGSGGHGGGVTRSEPHGPMLGGGAGAGGVAGHDHYPVAPGQMITGITVGFGAQSRGPDTGQPPPGMDSNFGTLVATGGQSARLNDWLNVGGGQGQLPAPIRWKGGWGGYAVPPGQNGQGAGGGGGGAGASGDGRDGGVNGSRVGQPGGPGGPGGGGQGAGGCSPFVNGQGGPGHQPGGAGSGATMLYGYGGWLPGGPGGHGKISIAYVQSQAGMRSFLAHMPNPDSDATFVPVIPVGDGFDPPSLFGPGVTPTPYPVISPHPGMPVKYNGTYTVALTAGWLGPSLGHPVQAEIRINGPIGPIGSVFATAWVNRDNDPLNQQGLVMLGSVTLPPKWMPPDNQMVSYDVIIWSSDDQDRFLDLLLLDVTGSTVACVTPGPERLLQLVRRRTRIGAVDGRDPRLGLRPHQRRVRYRHDHSRVRRPVHPGARHRKPVPGLLPQPGGPVNRPGPARHLPRHPRPGRELLSEVVV